MTIDRRVERQPVNFVVSPFLCQKLFEMRYVRPERTSMTIDHRMLTENPEELMTREELIAEVKRLQLITDPLALIEGAWIEERKGAWYWEPTNKDHQIWCTLVEDGPNGLEIQCSNGLWTYVDSELCGAVQDLEDAKDFAVRMLIQIANAHANSAGYAHASRYEQREKARRMRKDAHELQRATGRTYKDCIMALEANGSLERAREWLVYR